jgi:RND family efflux transporter MFP subunit
MSKKLSPLLGAALLLGCSDTPPPRPDPMVVAATAGTAPGGDTVQLNGTVAARVDSAIAFRVAGQLAERLVLRGQAVRKGEALARLDVTDFALSAREAAEQAAAADRVVAAAQAVAGRATADERRQAGLVASGSLSAQAFDGTRAAGESARADLAAAQSRAAAARAAAGRAANQRGYATLFAEADGIVTDLLVEPGEVVAAGQPILRLARAGSRDVVVLVPEDLRARLPRTGAAMILATGERLPVRLRELGAAADPRTRSFEARYALSGGEALLPGMTANLDLRPDVGSEAPVSVPLAAVIERGHKPGVWVIGADRTVTLRAVRLGDVTDDRVRVTSGLRSGETVVALGAHLLADGQRVRIGSLPK